MVHTYVYIYFLYGLNLHKLPMVCKGEEGGKKENCGHLKKEKKTTGI